MSKANTKSFLRLAMSCADAKRNKCNMNYELQAGSSCNS
jgi:hypothetical protein